MRQDVIQWTNALVASLVNHQTPQRIRSIALFGSWTSSGPLWKESDLDVFVVPTDRVDALFLRGVSLAVQECAATIHYPISPVVRNWTEIPAMVGPLTAALYCHSAQTLYGEDLLPVFRQVADSFPTLELRRSALCALFLMREEVRGVVVKHDGIQTMSHTAYRAFLKTCLGIIRCAVWVESADFSLNEFSGVLSMAVPLFGSVVSMDLGLRIYQELITDRIDEQCFEDLVTLIEALANHVTQSFLVLDGETTLRLHMNF